jgi:spore coat protein H
VEIYVDVGDGPVYWGVYTMFEDPCGELLDSWFDDDDGNCYKADGTGATLASFDASSFENKTNDDDTATDIEALVDALHDDGSSAEEWRAGLEERFDVHGFLRTMAVSNLIGSWDGYGNMTHNYYLYADPALDGRLVWVPWDFNLTYDASHIGDPLSITMDEVGDDWPLIRLLMDDEEYAASYYAQLEELVEGSLSEQAQRERFEAAHTRIAASAAAESGTFTNISESFDGALETNSDAVLDWIDDSLDEVAAAL